MMKTNIGTKRLKTSFVGNKRVLKIFVGNEQVYISYHTVTWAYRDSFDHWTYETTTVTHGNTPVPPITPPSVQEAGWGYFPLEWDDLSPVYGDKTITMTYKTKFYVNISSTHCYTQTQSDWYENEIRIDWTSDNNHSFGGSQVGDTDYRVISSPSYIMMEPDYVSIAVSTSNSTFKIGTGQTTYTQWRGIVRKETNIYYTVNSSGIEGVKYSYDSIDPNMDTATDVVSTDVYVYSNPQTNTFYRAVIQTAEHCDEIHGHETGWYAPGTLLEWSTEIISSEAKYSFSSSTVQTYKQAHINGPDTYSSGNTYLLYSIDVSSVTNATITANGPGWYLANATTTTMWEVVDSDVYTFDPNCGAQPTANLTWIADEPKTVAYSDVVYQRKYIVSFDVLNESGSWTQDTIKVPYNTTWSAAGRTVTLTNVGSNTFTSASKTGYNITGFSITPTAGVITADTTITGETQYLVKYFNIHFSATDGTWSRSDVSIPYGTNWSSNNGAVTFNTNPSTVVTFTPVEREGYIAAAVVNPDEGTVTGTATIAGSTNYSEIRWSLQMWRENYIASITYAINGGTPTTTTALYPTINNLGYNDTVVVTATPQSEPQYNYFDIVGEGTYTYSNHPDTVRTSCDRAIKTYELTLTNNNTTYGTAYVTRTPKSTYASEVPGTQTFSTPGLYTVYYGDAVTVRQVLQQTDEQWNPEPSVTRPSYTATVRGPSVARIQVDNFSDKTFIIYYKTPTGSTYYPFGDTGIVRPNSGLRSDEFNPNKTYTMRERVTVTQTGTATVGVADSGNYQGTASVSANINAVFNYTATPNTPISRNVEQTYYADVTTPAYVHTTYTVSFPQSTLYPSNSYDWSSDADIIVTKGSTITYNTRGQTVTITDVDTGTSYTRSLAVHSLEDDATSDYVYSFNSFNISPSTTVNSNTTILPVLNRTQKGYALKYTIKLTASRSGSTYTLDSEITSGTVPGYALFVPSRKLYGTPINYGTVPSQVSPLSQQNFKETPGGINTGSVTMESSTTYNSICVKVTLTDNIQYYTKYDDEYNVTNPYVWVEIGKTVTLTGTVYSKYPKWFDSNN